MTDTGLPPDLPGEARPNYGAQPVPSARPYYPPPAPSTQIQQPVYAAQPGYTPPVYPAAGSGGLSTGAKVGIFGGLGCLVLIIVPVIIAVIAGLMAASTPSANDYDPWNPTTDDGVSGSDNNAGPVESTWKSGDDWVVAPAGETPPTAFLSDFDSAEDYLQYQMGADYNFNVVFTSDPAYNCGMAKVAPEPTAVIGCYEPKYGKTLFIWWGDEADGDLKQLILLHEYSHFWQNWENFDATQSAVDAGLFDDPEFVQDVWETDATCRIYVDWHYTTLRYLDANTVSPCGDTGWGEHWFENELLERGVQVTDY